MPRRKPNCLSTTKSGKVETKNHNFVSRSCPTLIRFTINSASLNQSFFRVIFEFGCLVTHPHFWTGIRTFRFNFWNYRMTRKRHLWGLRLPQFLSIHIWIWLGRERLMKRAREMRDLSLTAGTRKWNKKNSKPGTDKNEKWHFLFHERWIEYVMRSRFIPRKPWRYTFELIRPRLAAISQS